MFSTIISAAICGLQVEFVRVEADTCNGLPLFHMVGYLSSEVKEAGERVKTAIKNSGFLLQPQKTVINLSPANVRKRGAAFDLPIAVAVLVSFNILQREQTEQTVMVGELGLDGTVQKIAGVLPIVDEAKKRGYQRCIVPMDNEAEASLVKGIEIIGVRSLRELCEQLRGTSGERKKKGSRNQIPQEIETGGFEDIKGQEAVKRAAEIAAAGAHNLLMIGPPGVGKTMIAKCLPSILPKPDWEECLEITKIYSIMGLTSAERPMITRRPFRQVHHTITKSALLGGGVMPSAGEISLANKGILMIDELAECKREVIESLRQPMEEKIVRIHRRRNTYVFPADCMIVAAMNPCPCGHYPDLNKCCCTEPQIRHYTEKISAPFLDRIDLCAEVPKMSFEDLTQDAPEESSKDIQKRVEAARAIQAERFYNKEYKTNAHMTKEDLQHFCAVKGAGEQFLRQAYEVFGLTARTYHRLLKVGRTIADMEGAKDIRVEHLKEALGYRIMGLSRR